VLPKDRNYRYGWQRFQAGTNNRNDFSNTVAGTRDGVIYLYWPDTDDWRNCRTSLEATFAVDCIRQDDIGCPNGNVVLSYWAPRQPTP
jgi:hypothetical protein